MTAELRQERSTDAAGVGTVLRPAFDPRPGVAAIRAVRLELPDRTPSSALAEG